ncbi:MAG TPA: nitrile hydratase accessory protein [Abditibacteriaceae bacterium]
MPECIENIASDMLGEGSPPRRNGELLFNEPWEGRAFGMAVALSQQGHYEWEAFRQQLIASINEWEAEHLHAQHHKEEHHEAGHYEAAHSHEQEDHSSEDGWNYYQRWLLALERLTLEMNMIDSAELEKRTMEFMTRHRDEAF